MTIISIQTNCNASRINCVTHMFDVQGRCRYQHQHIMHIWLHLEPGMCLNKCSPNVSWNSNIPIKMLTRNVFFLAQIPSGGERAWFGWRVSSKRLFGGSYAWCNGQSYNSTCRNEKSDVFRISNHSHKHTYIHTIHTPTHLYYNNNNNCNDEK